MTLPETFDLGKTYKQYFKIVPALSDDLKDEVFKIRHQVFCEDLGFEAQRSNQRETDEYDAHSIHVLIRSVRTGTFIGCTRIIRPRPADLAQPLPFEKICDAVLDRSIVDPAKLRRDAIGEISRLAVVSQFRRRKGEEKMAVPVSDQDSGTEKQPRFSFIPISLYLAAAELARLHRITTCFVLTEVRLADHFRKIGFGPQIIGGAVEHRGTRLPSMIIIPPTIIEHLRVNFRPLYQQIAGEIATHLGSQMPLDPVPETPPVIRRTTD